MKKILIIGWKDFTVIWRDRAALILMLAAPFVLTLGLGFVSGRFSGETSGLSDIPVVLVNQDQGALGQALVDVFASPDLAGLVLPSTLADPAAARAAGGSRPGRRGHHHPGRLQRRLDSRRRRPHGPPRSPWRFTPTRPARSAPASCAPSWMVLSAEWKPAGSAARWPCASCWRMA